MGKHISEAQIVQILDELRSGTNIDEICRHSLISLILRLHKLGHK